MISRSINMASLVINKKFLQCKFQFGDTVKITTIETNCIGIISSIERTKDAALGAEYYVYGVDLIQGSNLKYSNDRHIRVAEHNLIEYEYHEPEPWGSVCNKSIHDVIIVDSEHGELKIT